MIARHPRQNRLIAWVTVVIHIVACCGFVVCAEGLEIEPSPRRRFAWISDHPTLWRTTWVLWTLASISLILFAYAWLHELPATGAWRAVGVVGFAIMASGLPFDLLGEWINIAGATVSTFESFTLASRAYTTLSVAIANGLYAVGGLILSIVSHRLGWLRGTTSYFGIAMWLTAVGLTVAALGDDRLLKIIFGGLVMAFFIPWAALVGWRMGRLDRPQSDGV